MNAPSSSRSRLDAIYAALPAGTDVPLAKVVAVSEVDRAVVQDALRAAQAGQVAQGVNGRWSRSPVSRTTFRDRTVLGAVGGNRHTFEGILACVPVSRPQLYTSLARLQVAGQVAVERDGTRTPRYARVLNPG